MCQALVWIIETNRLADCDDILLSILREHDDFAMLYRISGAMAAVSKNADTSIQRWEKLTAVQRAAVLPTLWANEPTTAKKLAKGLLGANNSDVVRLQVALTMLNSKERNALTLLVELLNPMTKADVRAYALQALKRASGKEKLPDDPKVWQEWLAKNADASLRLPIQLTLATFEMFAKRVSLYSTGFQKGNSCEIWLDGRCLIGDEGKIKDRRGINVLAEHAGEILLLGSYDVWGSAKAATEFANDIEELPTGCYVAIATSDEPSQYWNAKAQKALESVGAKNTLQGKYRAAFFCIGRKGMAKGKAIEALDVDQGPLYHPPTFRKRVTIHENGPDEYRKEPRIRIKRGKSYVVPPAQQIFP